MGQWFSSFGFTNWFAPKTRPLCIMCIGLDRAGKTTLFRRLTFDPDRPGQHPHGAPAPTVGFNQAEYVTPEGHTLTMWDLGGQERLRRLWATYFSQGVDGVMFVVDGTDPERFDTALAELKEVLNNDAVIKPDGTAGEAHDAALLVMVNKSDVKDGTYVDAAELQRLWDVEKLLADAITKKRGPGAVLAKGSVAAGRWKCAGCSAQSGAGVGEAVKWFSTEAAKYA